MSEVIVSADIFNTQPTCGELSCDQCNERYEKAVERIKALEDVVIDIAASIEHPEYIYAVAGDQYNMMCPSSPIKVNTTASWLVIGGAGFGRSLHKVRGKADRLKTAVETVMGSDMEACSLVVGFDFFFLETDDARPKRNPAECWR